MPLFKEWSPNLHSLAGIWRADEPEEFFKDKTRLNSDIRHPRRRIEHLAGRYLLQHLKDDFPLHHIAADIHDKPRLPENQYFFSISHSYPYVAAVISDLEECGIDIQVWKKNIADIAHMFLSEDEQQLCTDSSELTLAWSIKEAAYKWYGRRGTDFIRDMPISRLLKSENADSSEALEKLFVVQMNCHDIPICPSAQIHKDFALASLIKYRSE